MNTWHGEQNVQLQMILEENEQVFHVGDSVKLVGGFRNLSTSPVWLDGRIAYKVHLNLKVTDINGHEVEFPGSRLKIRLAPPTKDDFVKLASGTMLLRSDITNGNLKFEQPGTYTISLSGSHGSSESYAMSFGISLGSIGKSAQITVRIVV
ncbi:MAG: hypothetical protein ACOYON_10160 [Fimbriimonas sp.]